ncbi:MAG TPA: peptidase M55 [Chloroflexi bacterium]|jgi:D-amino peptidase|nr:peptidase M55 [Chloroflexota bacterium]
MDVFISADVEGVAGIASWSQITPGSDDYAVGRSLMVGEVNAAIEGAFDAGADRVVVNDSHSRMTNLPPEQVDARARLISGHYKPMYMLQGIDDSFDAAFFIGYHGAIGEPEAILSHTYNPRAIWEAKIDGRAVGEIGINLLVCEYFGVPVLLVTGDQTTALEARELIPGIHVAEVKRSFGRYSAESLSPSEARKIIRRAAEESLQGLPKPPLLRRAVTMEVTFLVADMASMSEWVRGVERSGPRTVSFRAADGLEAYQTFYALLTLTRSLVE